MLPFALSLIALADLPSRPANEPRSAAELYNAYRWYGLPLPPKGSRLIRWEENWIYDTSDGKRTWLESEKRRHLGVLVRPIIGRQPAVVWYGDYETLESRPSRLRPIKPTPAVLDGMEDEWLAENWLHFSAQAYHLKWRELAEAAFRRGRVLPGSGQDRDDVKADPKHVLNTIRRMAWQNAYHQLTETLSDRRSLLQRLRAIAADDPGYQGDYQIDLFRSFEMSIGAGWRKRTPVEALIDGLVDSESLYYLDSESNDSYSKLVEMGFDAVPFLIDHLNDERATRTTVPQGMNRAVWVHVGRVGESCGTILYHMMGVYGVPYWEFGPRECFRERAKAWFADARKMGEERWALENAVTTYGYVNPQLLRLLRAKYAQHLPDLYFKVLRKRPNLTSESIAQELAASRLDRKLVVTALHEGAAHKLYSHREAAILALEKLDRAEFLAALRSTLSWLTSAEIEAKQKAAGFAIIPVVLRADDPACWDGLRELIRKSSAEDRIGVLESLSLHYGDAIPKPSSQPIRILEASLQDDVVREKTKSGHHRPPAREYPRLSVRNFAALKLADYLDIDVPWKPDRTPAEWAAIREQVKAALAAERKTNAK